MHQDFAARDEEHDSSDFLVEYSSKFYEVGSADHDFFLGSHGDATKVELAMPLLHFDFTCDFSQRPLSALSTCATHLRRAAASAS